MATEMKADGIDPALGYIRLIRTPASWGDQLRKYRVLIDGDTVGRIAPGEICDFAVKAGDHRLKLKLDFASSREKVVFIAEGGIVEFVCKPAGPAILAIVALLRPWRYICLEGPTG